MRAGGPWAVRLFRMLVRLLPPSERRTVGRRVALEVERGYRERRKSSGTLAAWGFLARETSDLLKNVVESRMPNRRSRRRSRGTLEKVRFDARLAVRALVRRPTQSLGAVVTLGIGIGANVALASLLYTVVLRPLPYEEPERLAAVYIPWDDRELGVAWSDIAALDDDARTVDGIAGALLPGMDNRTVLRGPDGPEAVEGVRVTPNFFTVLGVEPGLGEAVRADGPLDEVEPSVYLSHGAWLRRFGGDPDVVGRTLTLQMRSHRVAGVLPSDFDFRLGATSPELFLVRTPEEAERSDGTAIIIQGIARLGPGVEIADLRSELARLSPELDELRDVSVRDVVLRARPLHEHLVGDVARPLTALTLVAGLVLLVTCANLAMLFVARHMERETDQALRAALGAGRRRLASQPMLEALLLGAAGGALGVVVARATTGATLGILPTVPFRFDGLELGPPVLAAAVALSVLAGALCGALPAWLSARACPGAVLRRSSRGRGGSGGRATRVLAGMQAAALVVLLVATGLSIRSLESLLAVDLGFETDGRATATLLIPADRASSRGELGAFLDEVDERLARLPDVVSAGTITHLPLDPDSWGGSLQAEGEPPPDPAVATEWELASPGYFAAAGVELLRGRVFGPDDDASSPLVTVVSRRLAERLHPDGDVVGRRISGTGPEGPWMEIVGVVADVRQQRLDGGGRPFIYVPHGQMFPYPERALVVASRGDPMMAIRAASEALRVLEPDMVVTGVRPLSDLVDRATGSPRVVALLLSGLGVVSLLLALTGVYGVTACAVARRRRELGIRACLGARREELLARALATTLVPVGLGVAVGLLLVLGLAPRATPLLHEGVSVFDPLTLTVAPTLLLAAAAMTALSPARRAAGADPARVAREE